MDIVTRLKQLAHAVADEDWSEFSMRVPADSERDADLVLLRASKEIESLRAELAEYRRDAERYRRLCSLVAWGELGVCRGHNDTDEFADDGDMLDAWLDSPEMIAESQGIDAALAAKED